MIFISKGRRIEGSTVADDHGNEIELTKAQSLIWDFMRMSPKEYGDVIKYMGSLYMKGTVIRKDTMEQSIAQLKSLGLMAFSVGKGDDAECEMVLGCRAVPMGGEGIKDPMMQKIYSMAESGSGTLKDIAIEISKERGRKLDKPMELAVLNCALSLIEDGNICLA